MNTEKRKARQAKSKEAHDIDYACEVGTGMWNTDREALVTAEAALSRVIRAKCVGTVFDLSSPVSQCRDALKVVRDRLYGVYDDPSWAEWRAEQGFRDAGYFDTGLS